MVCLCEVLSVSCSWLEPDMDGFALSPVLYQTALSTAPGPIGTRGNPSCLNSI